jgi:hypothetical protein
MTFSTSFAGSVRGSKFHGQMGLALYRNSYKAPRVAALGYVLSTLPYSCSFSISARQFPSL